MSEIDHILRTSEDITRELSDYFKFVHPEWSIGQVYTTTLHFRREYNKEQEGRNSNDREYTVSS
jgi:hypothetical protein